MKHARAQMRAAWVLGSLMLASGCDDDGSMTPGEPEPPPSGGEVVFSSPVEGGNTYTCSTCHAVSEPARDGLRRPGHALGGATRRASFKNGQLTDILDAANSCLTEWMNAEPWTADDPDWLALYEFLDGESGAEAEVDFAIVEPPADLGSGDVQAGQATFNETCAVCHGRDGVGTQLAPQVAMRGLDADFVGFRVRTSGRTDSSVYEGLTGGVMPFWAADRLSDDELRDISTWLASTGDVVGGEGPETGELRGCGSTHPRVGSVAELTGFFHDVAGTATIVDDCTIRIDNFTFDGGGIDTRVYGGLGGDWDGTGFIIGENLVGTVFDGDTLTVQLDDDHTLDDLDGISIWCVPVGVDFGSGFFQSP